ncbi:MAG: hypothetical protein U5S82_07525 [Gammaproteobacteria bacterium]|nr:hypothetical protein [Gammaproteobacteria bacterium]
MERVLHGVFLVIHELGVLLAGAPGCGKSRLGLELVARGHALVADDCALFQVTDQGLVGTPPPHTGEFLHVRGLGAFNIRRQFGDEALCPQHLLHLIIELDPATTGRDSANLQPPLTKETRHGVAVAVLRVAPPWPGPALVEALVARHRLALAGYDTAAHLVGRQGRAGHGT